ncbi:uncharacterized protein LOC111323292 isoform X1 [Stylophora pistillata]|uniref:uncharacterized protein LOC111323292 isoform X1 n=1 Tax=Stylophora pistillata TaxID=50429 RepID=UPI000C03E472|nr:uncharacterized protein LOC111323292 isoform X1 [Stylophora pistillata]
MADKCGVEVIIKLGGSAVTQKNVFETVKREAILAAAELVKRIPAGKCIVIHGAGSFGHFQAHEYGTAHGFSNDISKGKIGFAKTRLSVTKLQHIITAMLVDSGIPALGISPCGSWVTRKGHVNRVTLSPIIELLQAGFVPVLHGDCVLDDAQGCAILSGDKIIEKLVRELGPRRVVFLTDVDGIYDKPPEKPDALLLRNVFVKSNGGFSNAITTSSLEHDVTGGVRGKLQTASNIIHISGGNTRVFVLNIMSGSDAYSVCALGVLEGKEDGENWPSSWNGFSVAFGIGGIFSREERRPQK